MSLEQKDIDKFKKIYSEKVGKELSDQEARESAQSLYNYVKLCFDLVKKDLKRKAKIKSFPKGFPVDSQYNCIVCRSKDRNCKNPAINEADLIKQFQKLADKLTLDEVRLNEKLEKEIKHFKKLQAMFLGKDKTNEIQKVDLRDYIKFILEEGSILEKRSMLGCLISNILLKKHVIILK